MVSHDTREALTPPTKGMLTFPRTIRVLRTSSLTGSEHNQAKVQALNVQLKPRGSRRGKSSSISYQRWFVRTTAVATLCTFIAATGTANGSAAAVIQDARPFGINHVYDTKPYVPRKITPKPREAETYQDRQERIAESKRSLLRPTEENRDADTICVSGEFTTLRVVFDSIFESTLPSLPPSMRAAARQQQQIAHRDMARAHVSTLAVSEHPMSLGADTDDPATKYRSPLSQIIVSDLLKIRDGRQNEAIALENITLTQAVETGWLYFFAGVLAPLGFGISVTPSLGSPLTSAPAPLNQLAGYVSYNTLLQIAFQGSKLGLQLLYASTSNAFLNQCVAKVTQEQKDQAGKPSEDVIYDIPIAPIISETANQLALADSDKCAPVGSLSLGRIISRTGEYAKAQTSSPAAKRKIDAETKRILAQAKTTRVHHNLIPADPADFTQAEQIASLLGSLIPYVGGAPLDIILGLTHNNNKGDNMLETVSIADLTVTKSLTAAYYSYYLSLYLFSTAGGLLEAPLLSAAGISTPFSFTRIIGATLGLPLTYGLISYHNVIRSMCLVEDDQTGTGKGAEANKTSAGTSTTPSSSASRSAAPSSAPAGRQNSSASTRTTSSSTKPAAPKNPAIPDWLPIPR